jgi:glycosyltransferase involved in cell wall biosynthesis
MNILLISDAYPPEVRSASRLMFEFAEAMNRRGHKVTVLTAYPEYNLAEGSQRQFNTVEYEGTVKVVRIRTMKIHLVGLIQRGIGVLSLPYFFEQAGKRYVDQDIDIILVYSPPLPLAIAGRRLARHFRAKLVVNVQDLFPQNAIDLGAMTNPLIIRFFEGIESYAYRSADFITVHSAGNLKILNTEKQVPQRKTAIFHNWVNTKPADPDGADGEDLKRSLGLKDKFVILFGGVMGPAQGLEVILPAALELEDTNACFLLVGDGTEKKKLQAMTANQGLSNVVFKPFVELHVYESLMQCADVGLVTLHQDMKTPVVPGKLVSFLSQKIPVVASLNPESDGRQIISEGNCGLVGPAGDGATLARNVRHLIENPQTVRDMGESGYAYVKAEMNLDKVMDQYERLFAQLQAASHNLGQRKCANQIK